MATNTVNYINPAAIMPKNNWAPGGLLGGYLHMQQQGEFEKMLALEQLAQQMGVQRQGMELQDYTKDQPLRDLTRQGKLAEGQAQLPFIGELARATAQEKIAGSDFKRKTEYSNEKLDDFFKELKSKGTKRDWEQVLTEQSAVANMANQALQIEATQGALAAEAFVRNQAEQMRARGVNIPQEVLVPQNWKPLRDSAIYSVQTMQDMVKQEQKEKGMDSRTAATLNANMEIARTHAGARVEAAAGGGANPRNIGNKQEAPTWRERFRKAQENNTVTPELLQQGRTALSNEFFDNQSDFTKYLLQQNTPKGKAAQEIYQEHLERYLQDNGIPPATGARKVPPPTQPRGGARLPAPVMGNDKSGWSIRPLQ